MSLENWLNNAWLEKHKTSKQEISGLFGIVERNLNDVDKVLASFSLNKADYERMSVGELSKT